MGLRDRDYTRRNVNSNKRRPHRANGWSVVVALILINFILWFADGLLVAGNQLTSLLSLRVGSVPPSYQLLTYGFAHDPDGIWHILLNMFGLMMFGYGMMLGIGPQGFGFVRGENVEQQLGRREFLAFYCLTIILGGVVFTLINLNVPNASVLGASGGVCGVIILFAWMFPKKVLLIWGILPLPMWVIGILFVIMDAAGAAGIAGCCGIAYAVHLAGAAFGTFYYFVFFKQKRKLLGWVNSLSPPSSPKPKLRIHTPDDSPKTSDEEFNHRLDEILKRYGEVGEAGLTSEEREFLQQASKKFAKK